MRRPKLRRDGERVSPALASLLTWGDWRAAHALVQDEDDTWDLFAGGDGEHSHESKWRLIAARAVAEWAAVRPGSRPASWWQWSAPELRQISGRFLPSVGRGRCHPAGLPYGMPADWSDLPMVETQAAYLERLNLWVPGERERVPDEAFQPEPFSYSLGVLPQHRPAER